MGTWLIVALVVAAVLGSVAVRAAVHGRGRRPGSRRLEGDDETELPPPGAGERELSPREKLAREAGVASFGLNLPWWKRPESYRRRP